MYPILSYVDKLRHLSQSLQIQHSENVLELKPSKDFKEILFSLLQAVTKMGNEPVKIDLKWEKHSKTFELSVSLKCNASRSAFC